MECRKELPVLEQLTVRSCSCSKMADHTVRFEQLIKIMKQNSILIFIFLGIRHSAFIMEALYNTMLQECTHFTTILKPSSVF